MNFVVSPPETVVLPVAGGLGLFPIRRVFCVGRNYAAHTREMGRDPTREPPFFFTKPADAVILAEKAIPYPPLTGNLHYEIELVVAIGKGGAEIAPEQALDHVYGYGVGLDLTRRDLQLAARDLGRPWDWGKAFDNSAPISALRPAAQIGHPSQGRIWLSVNGVVKQDADIGDMIWNIPEIVAEVSRAVALRAGDLIMTGTPAGVGPIVAGDQIEGGVEGVGALEISISPPAAPAKT